MTVAAASLAVFAAQQHRLLQNIEFMERITGMSLNGLEDVELYDNAETLVALHAKASAQALKGMGGAWQRIRSLPRGASPSPIKGTGELMGAGHREPPLTPGHLRVEGCTDDNSWYAVWDPETNELWLVVAYPDWGGDSPHCLTDSPWVELEPASL